MKTSIIISIDKALLSEIKKYAIMQDTSISALVTDHFNIIIKPKNIIEIVEVLESHQININTNLNDAFYIEKAKEYGF